MSGTLRGFAITLLFQAVKVYAKGSSLDDDDDILPSPGDETPPGGVDPGEGNNPVTDEIFSSWALFIMLFLLISALWSSYFLAQRRIKAVHETVLSIFYGMVVGLIIRLSPGHYIQDAVTFNSSYFFNVLLPPIILNSGYELNQAKFFNNILSILIFAIPGTFISAVVVGVILYFWTSLGLESVDISFVDALSVGATLSATDPVTILSIFNAYKVDSTLYTIIFGESLLNDAISIVMFETCQKFHGKPATFSSVFEGIGLFLMTFTVSLLIGMMIGILVALILKHSLIRRFPRIESCLVLLIAYQSYFFSNGCHMSGIVSLLFCGITLKHYAYYNMSRRTQIAIKYIFQLLAQLSENFIFIYLGLSLFTEVKLVYKPLLIIITSISICVARWCAVFPLSNFVNWFYRMKDWRSLRAMGAQYSELTHDEIPYNYQMMIFWAGLRGAVGVALATGIQGEFKFTLLATVLVVVVLTVIIFGGTTAGMIDVLGIFTGLVDDDESDDEFDIEMHRSQDNLNPNFIFYGADPRSADPRSADLRSAEDLTTDFPAIAKHQNSPPVEQPQASSQPLERQHLKETLSSIFTSDSKWFTNLDEHLLKPVFLENPSSSPGQGKKSGSETPNFLGSRR
ncbi:LAFE_0F13916g1_1 [Lachancea fermentati]|uniref:Sodium/hydrogen exchanger n=1 Tax=Lachancea fermentati TaxID=4955 RepID=A0A1G4MG96_LACFM|nr:LAFE_0F13916g1_1 [Lachancea fermentati]